MKSIQEHITELDKEGLTFLENEYSKDECNYYIDKFSQIIKKFKSNGSNLCRDCTMIRNPYRHDIDLANLIYNANVDSILLELIDKDYVLVNSTVINRKIDHSIKKSANNMGDAWHTDSHYTMNQTRRLQKGFGYIVIILFNDFTKENGGTLYLLNSHLKKDKPEKFGEYNNLKDYPLKTIVGKAGTVAIMDSGIWHRGGDPSQEDRWSLYSYYGPWYQKPYYRFPEMLGEKFGKETNKHLRRLFHYNSTPPLADVNNESTSTVKYD